MKSLSMLTIRSRIILASTFVFAVLLTAFSVGIYQSFKNSLYVSLDAYLLNYGERLQSEIEEQHAEKIFPDISELRSIKPEGLGPTALRLVDSTGKEFLSDSLFLHIPFPSWKTVAAGSHEIQDVQIQQSIQRSLRMPVEVLDRIQYSLQIVTSESEVESSLGRLRLILAFVSPLTLVVAATATWAIVRRAFRPINGMVRTAQAISAMNLRERIPVPTTNDEVQVLARALNAMIDRLDEALKIQKQFIAEASHEFRTPLAILQSELEFASRRKLDRDSRESIAASLSEIDHLKRLTNDLLMLTRLDGNPNALELQTLRVDELLLGCIQRMSIPAQKKDIKITPETMEPLQIRADRDRLSGAITNILDNAIKYSHPGDAVLVSVRATGDSALISVQDHGPGISPEELTSIFNRFHRGETSRASHEGTGLGLAISQKVIQLHSGEILIESEVGKGSVFTIKLPLS